MERLDEIRSRVEKATNAYPLPWTIEDGALWSGQYDGDDQVLSCCNIIESGLEFIAHAPADIDYLLDEVDRLATERGNEHDSCVTDAFMAAGEIVELRAALAAATMRAEQAEHRAWQPSTGHWLVQNDEAGEHRWTCVGEIASLDEARVRVALQQADAEACRAILAVKTRASGSSAHDIYTAVADVIARRYAAGGRDAPATSGGEDA